jgi:hypothetical protein
LSFKKAQGDKVNKITTNKKPKGNCFHCGKPGHWKKSCRHYLASLKKDKLSEGMSNILIIETNLMDGPFNSWCVDSSATSHICNILQEFKETRRLNKGEVILKMGMGATVAATAIGTFYLELSSSRTPVLDECLYVPEVRRNLISFSRLGCSRYSFLFTAKLIVKFNNKFVASGILQDGLYIISSIDNSVNCIENDNAASVLSLKRKRDVNQTYMWHLRLDHINIDMINRLVRDEPLKLSKVESYPICEPCLQGKMTKNPFTRKGVRATNVLELIHTDVCGPLTHMARGGFFYFITFIDDHSRYGYLYLMKHKSESFEKFKEFCNEVEKQTRKCIKVFHSDRGGEHFLDQFKDHLKKNDIISQLTPPGTPQHNGVAKRRNRTLLDMVHSMMNMSELPVSFWDYVLETAVYLLNRVPSKSVPNTPYEL